MAEVQITGASSELAGVGRLPDGRAVFVPGAIPGEKVDVRVTRDGGRFCEGRIQSIVEASPDRVRPLCPLFGVCGGCQTQHMRYEASLAFKKQVVVDALTRIGKVPSPLVLDTVSVGDSLRTRNKAEYPVVRSGTYCGVTREGSWEVLRAADCFQQKTQSVRVMQAFSAAGGGYGMKYVVTRFNRAGQGVVVFSGGTREQAEKLSRAARESEPGLVGAVWCRTGFRPAHALDGATSVLWGEDALSETLSGVEFRLSSKSFFQVNPDAAEALYTRAVDAACEPGGKVVDVYCGAGTMTLLAAKRVESVGIEIVPEAVRDARENARRNGSKAQFVLGDAARELPRMLDAAAVILDPPRKGIDPPVAQAINASRVGRVVYVSCNPATLARDVKLLSDGGFQLDRAQPVDMFPMTKHIETVAVLSRET